MRKNISVTRIKPDGTVIKHVPEVHKFNQVEYPLVKLVPHSDGGWAVHGGGRVTDIRHARHIAKNLNKQAKLYAMYATR